MSEVATAYEASTGVRLPPSEVSRRASWHACGRRRPRYGAECSVFSRLRPGIRESRLHSGEKFAETLLHVVWRRVGAASATVTGRDGHRYTVIYPGRPADGAGPDFRDAVLLRDDGLRMHGHVEVHVRSSDWHRHGHTSDGAYNGVVLHVVGEESGPPIDTPSGIRIPLLVLDRKFVEQQAALCETPKSLPSSVPLPELDMSVAGDEWFRNRVHGYALQISGDPDQVIWEGALECLGYPANKKGFRQLAARLNWATVSNWMGQREKTGSGVEPAAMFEWAAGFRPRPEGAPAIAGKAPEWRARHGRPANSPKSRLRAASAWVQRWQASGGPSQAFLHAVKQAKSPGELSSLLFVQPEHGKTASLGLSRARDIVVNHLLPVVHALADSEGDSKLADHAKRLFDAHPLLSSNSITREASRLLQAREANGKPRTAREQQGLIHIYRMAVSSQRPEQQLPLL